jgi:hypothetical protein
MQQTGLRWLKRLREDQRQARQTCAKKKDERKDEAAEVVSMSVFLGLYK